MRRMGLNEGKCCERRRIVGGEDTKGNEGKGRKKKSIKIRWWWMTGEGKGGKRT